MISSLQNLFRSSQQESRSFVKEPRSLQSALTLLEKQSPPESLPSCLQGRIVSNHPSKFSLLLKSMFARFGTSSSSQRSTPLSEAVMGVFFRCLALISRSPSQVLPLEIKADLIEEEEGGVLDDIYSFKDLVYHEVGSLLQGSHVQTSCVANEILTQDPIRIRSSDEKVVFDKKRTREISLVQSDQISFNLHLGLIKERQRLLKESFEFQEVSARLTDAILGINQSSLSSSMITKSPRLAGLHLLEKDPVQSQS